MSRNQKSKENVNQEVLTDLKSDNLTNIQSLETVVMNKLIKRKSYVL
jgi:hypothetical protein